MTALALQRRWLPPTLNLSVRDPECDLDYLDGTGAERRTEVALSNSFGFGGINAALVLKRAE